LTCDKETTIMEASLETARDTALRAFSAEGPAHKNCAQSVMIFVLAALGLDLTEASVARYLGGGVALSGLFCGALNGAALALAVRDRTRHGADWNGEVATATRDELQALLADFVARFGSSSCRDLTGCELRSSEGFRRFRDSGAHDRCAEYVLFACERLSLQL
jgi:C_GCAxxG_C_C family probable redox protein